MSNTHSSSIEKPSTGKKILKTAGIVLLGGLLVTAAVMAVAKVLSENEDPYSR